VTFFFKRPDSSPNDESNTYTALLWIKIGSKRGLSNKLCDFEEIYFNLKSILYFNIFKKKGGQVTLRVRNFGEALRRDILTTVRTERAFDRGGYYTSMSQMRSA